MMANVSPRTDTSADGDIDDKTPAVVYLPPALAAVCLCPRFWLLPSTYIYIFDWLFHFNFIMALIIYLC